MFRIAFLKYSQCGSSGSVGNLLGSKTSLIYSLNFNKGSFFFLASSMCILHLLKMAGVSIVSPSHSIDCPFLLNSYLLGGTAPLSRQCLYMVLYTISSQVFSVFSKMNPLELCSPVVLALSIPSFRIYSISS